MKTIAVFAALVAVAVAAPQFRQQRQQPFEHQQHFQQQQQFQPQPQVQVLSQPQVQQRQQPLAVLVRETPSDNIGLDSYKFGYELSDGQSRDESAQIETRSADPEDAVIRVRGTYSWVDPADGRTYSVKYYADETGFHAEGDHLPVA